MTHRVLYGVPKYESSEDTEFKSTQEKRRLLATEGYVGQPKPAKAARVAPEPKPKRNANEQPLSTSQTNRARKCFEALTVTETNLKIAIEKAAQEKFVPYMPPYLLPKARVAHATVVEEMAALEIMLVPEWTGSCSETLKTAPQARAAGTKMIEEIQEILGHAESQEPVSVDA